MAFERPSAEALAEATPEELAQLAADCMSALPEGRQPFNLFRQLRRLVVMSTIELVPLRNKAGKTEVLLGQRPTGPEEPWWGGMLNLPGSVVLPTEELADYHDYQTPSDRILREEFKGSVQRTGDIHIFDRGFPRSISGTEHKTWAWTTVDLAEGYDAPVGGDFYDLHEAIYNPPETLVKSHSRVILDGFRASRVFELE